MNTIDPAPGAFPTPTMQRHTLNHYHSDTMDRIALLAVKQVMAGMLAVPRGVKLVERNVTARFIHGKEQIEFRFTFAVELNEKSNKYTSWLVSIPCDVPSAATGMVSEVTPIREAKVYEWDDSRGWRDMLTFEHPYMQPTESWYHAERVDPLGWPTPP